MTEVAMPREHHGNAVLVARFDAFLVADGAAGLDDGGDAKACQRTYYGAPMGNDALPGS